MIIRQTGIHAHNLLNTVHVTVTPVSFKIVCYFVQVLMTFIDATHKLKITLFV